VEGHALRACDALQLALALTLRRRVRLDVAFVCFDRRLEEAAKAEELISV